MRKLYMLPEIQDQGQADKLRILKRETILFLIPRCPQRSTDEQVSRSGTPALLYIIFFLSKKAAENQNLLLLIPISTPKKETPEHQVLNKGRDGVWRRCGQEDKLCPVAFCYFPGENVALTRGFSFTLKFPCSYLKKGAGIY